MRTVDGSGSAGALRESAATERRERLGRLLKEAQDGRRDGLGQIIEELTPLMWRVARAQGLSTQDAEDAVQAAWLALLRHLAELRDPDAVVGWLLVVVKRESWRVRSAHGRERSTELQELSDLLAAVPAPEDEVVQGAVEDERRRAVRRALSRLPERCQQLLRVVAFAHRPDYDAVAAAVGMPRGSIGPTRGRCLAKMRGLLDADPRWDVAS
jgi:RNA polymerase sigma factor (sigma-70 family)